MHPLMPQAQTHQVLKLTNPQLLTLGKLARDHEGESCTIYQHTKTKIVHVEFIFPVSYILASNGKAIREY